MPNEKRTDLILFSRDFNVLGPVATILRSFDALFMCQHHPAETLDVFAAKGEVQDHGHTWGPALRVSSKSGQAMSIRIPWQQIIAVISGFEADSEAQLKAFGFGPAILATREQ